MKSRQRRNPELSNEESEYESDFYGRPLGSHLDPALYDPIPIPEYDPSVTPENFYEDEDWEDDDEE